MVLNREVITEMDEAALRTKVLIPLFEAMGFHDVYHHHGGALEQGKDIIMWRYGVLNEKENYAVVAKATNISGKARGTGSAGEIRTQIEESFGNSYLDPTTSEENRIHRCWVVTSGKITKEARLALKGILRDYSRHTEFIDGEKLWGLVQKFLMKKLILGNLQEAQEAMESVNPNFRVTVETGKDGVSYGIEPKHAEAFEKQPLNVATRFSFPNSEHASECKEAFDNFIKTGSPVTIPGEYVDQVKVPEFISTTLGMEDADIVEVKLSTSIHSAPLVVKAEVVSRDGERTTLDYIELKPDRAGSEQTVLNNDHQNVPFKIELRIDIVRKVINFGYTFRYKESNPKQELDGLLFCRALSRGGYFRLEDRETGIERLGTEIKSGMLEAPDESDIELLEKIVLIQKKCKTPLEIPAQGITRDDVASILHTAMILETGRATAPEVNLTMRKKDCFKNVEGCKDGKMTPLSFTIELPRIVLGNAIPLGPIGGHCSEVYMTQGNTSMLHRGR